MLSPAAKDLYFYPSVCSSEKLHVYLNKRQLLLDYFHNMMKTKLSVLFVGFIFLLCSCGSHQNLFSKRPHIKPAEKKLNAIDVIGIITLGILEDERDKQHSKHSGWQTGNRPVERFPPE